MKLIFHNPLSLKSCFTCTLINYLGQVIYNICCGCSYRNLHVLLWLYNKTEVCISWINGSKDYFIPVTCNLILSNNKKKLPLIAFLVSSLVTPVRRGIFGVSLRFILSNGSPSIMGGKDRPSYRNSVTGIEPRRPCKPDVKSRDCNLLLAI